MNQWINVESCLPLNDTIVKVKMCLLYWTEEEALFIKKYFVIQGENVTQWVTDWMPIPEPSK